MRGSKKPILMKRAVTTSEQTRTDEITKGVLTMG